MESFYYYAPTEVIFGRETEKNTARLVLKYGGSNVLVVYGGDSARKSGLLERIEKELTDENIPFRSIGGVRPNPHLDFAEQGAATAIQIGADFVLAVGGGSVIDTAKAIAVGAANPGKNLWSFWERKETPKMSLPVGVVLTIPASGSEMSDSAVLTNQDTGVKRGLSTELNRPRFAILNPELTFTLPKHQVACGVVDIMMHTLDRYFTLSEGNELTDELAEGLLRVVIRNGENAVQHPDDYHAMSELMWAGSLSHNGLTGLGAVKDFAVHQLGHELSAIFDVAHGASLSAVWGSWAKYVYEQKPERFAQYAEKVWQISGCSTTDAALRGIEKTVGYFCSLGMPVNFTGLKIGLQSDETLRELADRCVYRGTRKVGYFKEMDREDCYCIYKMANQ